MGKEVNQEIRSRSNGSRSLYTVKAVGDGVVDKFRLKGLGHTESSPQTTGVRVRSVTPEPAPRSGFLPLDLLLRPSVQQYQKTLVSLPRQAQTLTFPSVCQALLLLVFRCFYTPLKTAGVLFPWLLLLKSSFGNCSTCVTQDFQSFRRSGHLGDEVAIANELGVLYMFWV